MIVEYIPTDAREATHATHCGMLFSKKDDPNYTFEYLGGTGEVRLTQYKDGKIVHQLTLKESQSDRLMVKYHQREYYTEVKCLATIKHNILHVRLDEVNDNKTLDFPYGEYEVIVRMKPCD